MHSIALTAVLLMTSVHLGDSKVMPRFGQPVSARVSPRPEVSEFRRSVDCLACH